ncbi:MAG: hypothetical protein GY732_13175 [Gammaproteobacteria bacterium]|nr:hypothetical protein [Gammaproteobacteria bacterium]
MTKLVYTQENGLLAIVSGHLPASAPRGSDAITVEQQDFPRDNNFYPAWQIAEGKITVDLDKAKVCAHEVRRKERDAEFAPLDFLIAAQIPGNDPAEVEAQRVVIREADAAKQAAIDAATSVIEVQAVLYGIEKEDVVGDLIKPAPIPEVLPTPEVLPEPVEQDKPELATEE